MIAQLFVSALLIFFVGAQDWSAIAAFPFAHDQSIGAYVGSAFHVVINDGDTASPAPRYHHRFTFASGWTTLADMPSVRTDFSLAFASPTKMVAVGGNHYTPSTPPTSVLRVDYNEVYDLPSDTWTTKQVLPMDLTFASGAGSVADGVFYTIEGWTISSFYTSQAYHVISDTWTSLARNPTDYRENIAAAYTDGYIVSASSWGSPAPEVFVYSVVADTWTTASPYPAPRWAVASTAAIAGQYFLVGGLSVPASPTAHTNAAHVYTIATDTWETLASVPVPTRRQAVGVTQEGYLIVHTEAPDPPFALYRTTWSIIGDPLVTTTDGRSHHVDLFPGVFNLLTTPTVAVNAVFESLPALPPGEDLVMTMVAVVANISSSLVTAYCMTAELTSQCYVARTNTTLLNEVWSHKGAYIQLDLNDLSVQFHGQRIAMLVSFGGDHVAFAPSSYIDMRFVAHTALPVVGGLVASSEAPDSAEAYEVSDGCLFSFAVPATEGLFATATADFAEALRSLCHN